MQGIEDNGLAWKYNGPKIKQFDDTLARLNDDGFEGEEDAQALTNACHKLAEIIKQWAEKLPKKIREDFDRQHEEGLDFMASIDTVAEVAAGIYSDPEEVIEEINAILNDLYDTFDYHRILVQ
jgi:hypothetical protein